MNEASSMKAFRPPGVRSAADPGTNRDVPIGLPAKVAPVRVPVIKKGGKRIAPAKLKAGGR